MKKFFVCIVALFLIAGVSQSAFSQESGYGATLKAVMERGKVRCGGNTSSPAFGFLDSEGKYSGLDVDFCRAVAAAIFSDPGKAEIIPTTGETRFTMLQSGEYDVLIRSTTWTFTRDIDLGLNPTVTYFYDGQGILVTKELGAETLEDLEGASICVNRGSTTELNLADVMAAHGIEYTPVLYENVKDMYAAYDQGRCDAISNDKSGLVSDRTTLSNPADHVVMDVTLSKEPLASFVRHGDDQWYDLISWVFFATFIAEEHGITSENIDEVKANTTNPEVKRFLGLEGEMGAKLGLSNDWAYNIVKTVGNYAEIYDKHFGENSKSALPRGVNKLWTDGGLLYAPPFR